METQVKTKEESQLRIVTLRNLIAYWILGLCNNYGYVIMLSCANDILIHHTTDDQKGTRDCTFISTGFILLADILPGLLIKLVATTFLPFYVVVNMVVVLFLSCAGFIIVGMANSVWLQTIGVVSTAISSGLGEITLLGYMSFYDKKVLSTYASGTGGAGFIGALSYAFLTRYLSPRNTVLSMNVIVLIEIIVFWRLLVHPEGSLRSLGKISSMTEKEVRILTSTKEKLAYTPKLLKFMIPIGTVYLFEYIINQGYFALISFKLCWLEKAEQYRWLQVDYQLGVFISRSSVQLFQIKKIWLLSVLQFINLLLFTMDAIWFVFPNFWFALAMVLFEGLFGGAAYVNTFYRIEQEVSIEQRPFSMGFVSIANACGISLAGVLSIFVHNAVCTIPYGRGDNYTVVPTVNY